jgi:hypothetical protein
MQKRELGEGECREALVSARRRDAENHRDEERERGRHAVLEPRGAGRPSRGAGQRSV